MAKEDWRHLYIDAFVVCSLSSGGWFNVVNTEEIWLACLLGQVCTNNTFKKWFVYKRHRHKQNNQTSVVSSHRLLCSSIDILLVGCIDILLIDRARRKIHAMKYWHGVSWPETHFSRENSNYVMKIAKFRKVFSWIIHESKLNSDIFFCKNMLFVNLKFTG